MGGNQEYCEALVNMMKTMRLDPNYPQVIRWHANALATRSFVYGNTEPVAAFMDMVRYLTKVDEEEVFRIMHELDPSRAATMEEAHARSNDHAPSEGS